MYIPSTGRTPYERSKNSNSSSQYDPIVDELESVSRNELYTRKITSGVINGRSWVPSLGTRTPAPTASSTITTFLPR
jgi:hypothetical protein